MYSLRVDFNSIFAGGYRIKEVAFLFKKTAVNVARRRNNRWNASLITSAWSSQPKKFALSRVGRYLYLESCYKQLKNHYKKNYELQYFLRCKNCLRVKVLHLINKFYCRLVSSKTIVMPLLSNYKNFSRFQWCVLLNLKKIDNIYYNSTNISAAQIYHKIMIINIHFYDFKKGIYSVNFQVTVNWFLLICVDTNVKIATARRANGLSRRAVAASRRSRKETSMLAQERSSSQINVESRHVEYDDRGDADFFFLRTPWMKVVIERDTGRERMFCQDCVRLLRFTYLRYLKRKISRR